MARFCFFSSNPCKAHWKHHLLVLWLWGFFRTFFCFSLCISYTFLLFFISFSPRFSPDPPLPIIIYLIVYLFDKRSFNLSIDRSIYTFLAEKWVTNFILCYAYMCVCVVRPPVATMTIFSSSWWRGLICKVVTCQADPRMDESRAMWSFLACLPCSAAYVLLVSIRMYVMYVCIYVQWSKP